MIVDARIKLLCAAVLAVIPFIWQSVLVGGSVVAFGVIALLSSNIQAAQAWRTLRPILILCIVLVAVQMLLGGDYETRIYADVTSKLAWVRSLLRIEQLFGMVLLGLWVTGSGSPTALAEGIRWWLAPLRILRVPVNDMAMTLSIALASIPTMQEELDNLQLAQKARGIDTGRLGIADRVRVKYAAMISMFVLALRRSRQRGEAMYIRGYRSAGRHTSYRVRRLGAADALVVVLTCGVVLAAVFV